MSLIIKRFSSFLIAILFMMIGLDIVVLYYNLVTLPIALSFNLVVLGLFILLRGFKEVDKNDKKFYLAWGFLLIDIAISITVANILENNVIGFAVFLIGLGVLFLYISSL